MIVWVLRENTMFMHNATPSRRMAKLTHTHVAAGCYHTDCCARRVCLTLWVKGAAASERVLSLAQYVHTHSYGAHHVASEGVRSGCLSARPFSGKLESLM
jgi:hypothetical protein